MSSRLRFSKKISTYCNLTGEVEITFEIVSNREIWISIKENGLGRKKGVSVLIDGWTTWKAIKSFVDRGLKDIDNEHKISKFISEEGGENG